MRGRRTLLRLLVVGTLVGACSDSRQPISVTEAHRDVSPAVDVSPARFTSIDVPGAAASFPLDINNHGVVVGRYMSGGKTHGFVRDEDGEYTTIDYPGAGFSVAGAINDSGAIVGWYTLPATPTIRHGFLLVDGTFTTFDPPGSTFTNPLGISNRGDITGRYCTAAACRQPGNGDFRGFLFRDGEFTTIGVPDALETDAFKSDARGTSFLGGFVNAQHEEHLFVLWNDTFVTFTLPNGKSATLDNGGMNARGDIAGSYCDAASPCLIVATGVHGFLLSGDELTTIDYPGATATAATGINARGDIVGAYYQIPNGTPRGYLLNKSGRR